jgi:hypothetical protein
LACTDLQNRQIDVVKLVSILGLTLPFFKLPRTFACMAVLAALVGLPHEQTHAYTLEAWSGLASLELPLGAVASRQSSKLYLVQPAKGGRNVLLALTLHALSKEEQAASSRTLGNLRKRNFERDGFRVSRFVVDPKRGRISMDVSGRATKKDVPLDFKAASAMVQGRFVAIRSGARYVSALVVSERKNWASKPTEGYRRAADRLRVKR